MKVFDDSRVIHSLSSLPDTHRVGFAASCCERLLPNFEAFSKMENWGDPSVLRRALDIVWTVVTGVSLDPKELAELVAEIEPLIPDTEDFASIFTSAAQDAAASLTYTLECCRSGEVQLAALPARLAIGTLDIYLNIVNDVKVDVPHVADAVFEEWLSQSPLIKEEFAKQEKDLELLHSVVEIDTVVLVKLRDLSKTIGIQPFKRGLVK